MERIVEFLEVNRGKAFTAMEIHEHAFDAKTPEAEDDYASYSAILTQMTVHLASLTYLGDVEGKVIPNSELENKHEDGHTAYYTAPTDGDGEDGEDGGNGGDSDGEAGDADGNGSDDNGSDDDGSDGGK